MINPSQLRAGRPIFHFFAAVLTAIVLLASGARLETAAVAVSAPAASPDPRAIVPVDGTSAFQAVNQENAFVARVTGSAVRISSNIQPGVPWSVDLELRSFGLAGEEQPLSGVGLLSDGLRVVHRYGPLSRTVVNAVAGLEQEFEITAGPAEERRKEEQVLRFGLVYPTTLTAEPGKRDLGLRFLDDAGDLALALSIVRATDAAGAPVPVRFELTSEPGSLARKLDLIVTGAGATYPVRVTLRASRIEAYLEESPRPPIKKLEGELDDATDAPSSVLVAPPNDTCGGAEIIPPAGPFPYLTALTADITDATTAGDPSPMAGCPIGTPSPSRGIWYQFTPVVSGFYNIASCADAPTGSTVDDTILDVYTSSTGTCAGVMSPIACDDDACATEGLQSVVTPNLTAGTPYFILVHKWSNVVPTAGNTAIQLRVSPVTPPANDTCAGAIALSLNIPRTGSTLGGANDYTLSGAGCFALPAPPAPLAQTVSTAAGRDVVYSFTPAAAAGQYSFRVRNATGGINPVLYVVDSCPAPGAIGTPPCLGAANRRTTTLPVAEEVTCLPVAGGTTVYAFVDDSTFTGGGAFTIEVNDCTRESEANDTPASANNIAGVCGIEGSSNPGGNADFFTLGPVAPDSRIFAFADNTANNTGDHGLRVTNVTDTFEFDEDDGDVAFGQSGFEPVIAGTRFGPGGQAFLRVNPFSAVLLSEPYRLYHVEQPPSAAAIPEIEPNDPPNFNAAASNYFSGVTSTTDQDNYSFSALAGDLIYVSADNDPDMDGVATDTTIGLFDPVGTLVSQVNGSLAVSSTRAPVPGSLVATTPVAPGEALVYRAPVTGTYTAAILGVTAGPGNYLMSISKNCAPGGGGTNTFYSFPSVGLIVIQPLPPFFPGAQPEIIRLRQTGADATVMHGAQVADTIPGELLSLEVSGASPNLGAVHVRESPTRQSLGQTKVISPTEFNTFFDVFVDIDAGPLHLFNDQPMRVQASHTTQPPHDAHLESPKSATVLLYDVSDPPPGGAPRAQLLYVDHGVNPQLPPAATDAFDTTFSATIDLFPPLPPFSNGLTAAGGTVVRRDPPCLGCGPGGRDTIQTEMIELSLTGSDPVLGPYSVVLNHDPGYPPTLGRVTQFQPGIDFPADAFFDVFFEVDTQSFGRLVTRPAQTGAAHVEASVAQGNPVGTIPCGTGQDLRQPQSQQTLLYLPNDLQNPVGALHDIVHTIDRTRSGDPLPPAGRDCFNSRVTARISILPPFHPGGCTEDLVLDGPFKVLRGGPTDPGDGRDLISTIMACYRFAGTSSGASCGLGPLLAHPSSTNPSMGQIQSLAAAENFPAASFFDIFTEVETGIGPLHTNDPTHMETTIRSVPPGSGEIYFGPGVVVPLYNAANVQVGTFEVISHEVFNAIDCPCVCEPKVQWRANKLDVEVGIPQGGAGVQYDVAQGSVATPNPNWPASFAAVEAWALEGPFTYQWSVNPALNRVGWLLSRDGAFGTANGTLNSCPQTRQVGDRDLEVAP